MNYCNYYHDHDDRIRNRMSRRIIRWYYLLVSFVLVVGVVNSETTTVIVPLPTMTAKQQQQQQKAPMLSLSSMNGQTVLVLDEETASALKDTQSPINVILQPNKNNKKRYSSEYLIL